MYAVSFLRFVSECSLVSGRGRRIFSSQMLSTLTSFQTSGRMEQLPSPVPLLSLLFPSLLLFLPPSSFFSHSPLFVLILLLIFYNLSPPPILCLSCFSALKNTVVELFSPRRPLKPKRRGKRKPKPQVGEGGRRRMKEKDGGRQENRRRGEEKEEEEERRGWRKGRGSHSLDSCASVSDYRMSMWRVLILWYES